MADEVDISTDAILDAPGIRAAAIRESLLGEGQDECEDCGCEIPGARRAAMKSAIRCVPCQEIVDIKNKGRVWRG